MTVSRDGVEIAYATFGEPDGCAPAVVLVHGWSGKRGYWMHQADFLAERHHVIAVDLGGHGESGLGRDDWNLAPFREDFEAAVQRFVCNLAGETADGDLVGQIAAGMAAAPQEVAFGCLRYARNRQPPILAALQHIAAPIVAINPDNGPTDVDAMRRHGVEPIVLEGVGHFLMIEAPDRFNPVLAATLASFGNRAAAGDDIESWSLRL